MPAPCHVCFYGLFWALRMNDFHLTLKIDIKESLFSRPFQRDEFANSALPSENKCKRALKDSQASGWLQDKKS
jgi:hypothetical protein